MQLLSISLLIGQPYYELVNPIINWLFEQAVDPKYQFQWTLSKQTGPLAIIAGGLFK